MNGGVDKVGYDRKWIGEDCKRLETENQEPYGQPFSYRSSPFRFTHGIRH